MTLGEAQDLALIIGTADGGCHCCVEALCDKLNKAFPAFRWVNTNKWDDDDDAGLIVEVEPNGGE